MATELIDTRDGCKPTPGPWTAYEFGADWWVANSTDDSGPMLRVGSWHSARRANAFQIAASPDLVAALECLDAMLDFSTTADDEKPWVFDDWSELNRAFSAARSALLKAKGRPAD